MRHTDPGHTMNMHMTCAFTTCANGTVYPMQMVVHSGTTVGDRDIKGLESRPDWGLGCTENGSMELDVFYGFCVEFVRNLPSTQGVGGHPAVLLLDGHASRWNYAGIMYLISHNVWPFVIASHTSAWAQANDCGTNSSIQAIYTKEVEAWRRGHSCLPWTRAALNSCLVAAVTKFEKKMAAYVECRCPRLVHLHLLYSLTHPPPSPLHPTQHSELAKKAGKPGNVITRAFERTGSVPINPFCENWTKAIATIGIAAAPTDEMVTAEEPTPVPATRSNSGANEQVLRFQTSDTRDVVIRKIAMDAVLNHFTSQVKALSDAVEEHKKKKRKTLGAPNSKFGINYSVRANQVQLDEMRERREEKVKNAEATALRKEERQDKRAVERNNELKAALAIVQDAKITVAERVAKLDVKRMSVLLEAVGVSPYAPAEKKKRKRGKAPKGKRFMKAKLVALMMQQFTKGKNAKKGAEKVWKHAISARD